MHPNRVIQLRDFYRTELLENVVPFWSKYGVDREHGGFFTCLDQDGSVYSTDKPVWFMGRTTWLYASLFNRVEQKQEWLELAKHGYKFLREHCYGSDGKLYFSVTREGAGLQMRRYVFSEVFAVLAFSALATATRDAVIKQQAIDTFDRFNHFTSTPGLLPAKIDPVSRPAKGLSPLMCRLNLADELFKLTGDEKYETIITDSVNDFFASFVKSKERVVLEMVSPDGQPIDTPMGRVMNPGHAIETAWFLTEIGRRRNDRDLVDRSLQILDWSMEKGWDKEYGGLLYFVDVEGKPSPYLEHDMKLWWPHSEALYAALLAYHLTGNKKYSEMYELIHQWTFSHFPDRTHGEWFGYLRRDGSVSTKLKGNMWKGPFHVPRCMLLCLQLLEEMSS